MADYRAAPSACLQDDELNTSTINAIIIAIGLIVGAFILRDHFTEAHQKTSGPDAYASTHAATERTDSGPLSQFEVQSPGRSAASMTRRTDNFYWAEAIVNERSHINFMVDTGASLCVLTHADAEKIGFRWRDQAFETIITTAGGDVRGVRVRLDKVKISHVTIENVEAVVLENDIDQSLLGNSFLQKLRELRITSRAIIAYQ